MADSVGGVRTYRGGPASSDAQGRQADGAEAHVGDGLQRPAGHAIRAYAEAHGLEGFEYTDINEFDFSDPAAYDKYDWALYGTIINAGAFTAVDKAETPEGRPVAWKANAQGPALLAKVAKDHHITLVHVSSDYVFDGTADLHSEDEAFAPLGVYGQTKAAGDIAVTNAPEHYILRRSGIRRFPEHRGHAVPAARFTPNTASMPSVTDWTARKHQDQGRTSV